MVVSQFSWCHCCPCLQAKFDASLLMCPSHNAFATVPVLLKFSWLIVAWFDLFCCFPFTSCCHVDSAVAKLMLLLQFYCLSFSFSSCRFGVAFAVTGWLYRNICCWCFYPYQTTSNACFCAMAAPDGCFQNSLLILSAAMLSIIIMHNKIKSSKENISNKSFDFLILFMHFLQFLQCC